MVAMADMEIPVRKVCGRRGSVRRAGKKEEEEEKRMLGRGK